MAAALPATQASAAPSQSAGQVKLTAPASGSGSGQNLSARVASSWQTGGTVWALAVSKGVVYVGGNFTSVRPPGVALNGTGQVARSYLAAFNASTGALITTFAPTFTLAKTCTAGVPCGVTALAVSPDGSTLYVGGTFNHADGAYHAYLVAFSTSTGLPISTWKPAGGAPVLSIAPSPDGSEVYLGGNFTMLDGVARTEAGAVSAATGGLLPWAPALNGTVTSVAVAPDDSRVLVGGDFTKFNGVTQQAIGSTNPATGAPEPWALPPLFEPNHTGCYADVKDIVISGTVAYIGSEGTGPGCFDGDYAVNVSDGSLVWQNDCLGATQAIVVINGWLYKGSHAHDCAFAPGGFPAVATTKGFVLHHLLDQSLTDGSLGHFTADTDNTNLGPRVMATDGTQLFLGGAFLTVNGKPQQGFARFGPGPDVTAPGHPLGADGDQHLGRGGLGDLQRGQRPRRRHAELRDLPGWRQDPDRDHHGHVLAVGAAGAALPRLGPGRGFQPHLHGDRQRRREHLGEVPGLGGGQGLGLQPAARLLADGAC